MKRKREDCRIVRLKPGLIGFTQDTISKWIHMMRNGRKVKVPLDFFVDSILDGEVDIDSIKKIEVFQKTNLASGLIKWFSLDNRRLWIYKTLDELGYGDGDFSINCKHVRFENIFAQKFTTTNDGETVKVRGNVKDRVKLVAKRRCGSTMNPGEGGGHLYLEDEIINPIHEDLNDTVPAGKKLKTHSQSASSSEGAIKEPDDSYTNAGLQINMKTKCISKKRKRHRKRTRKPNRMCTNYAVTDNSSNFVPPQPMPFDFCSNRQPMPFDFCSNRQPMPFDFCSNRQPMPFDFCSNRQPMPPNTCRQPFSDVSNLQNSLSFNNDQQSPFHFDHIYSNSSNRLMVNGENIHQNGWQRDENLQHRWNSVGDIRCQPPLFHEGQLPRFSQQIPRNFQFSNVHHPQKNTWVMQIPAAPSYNSRADFSDDLHYDELLPL